MPAVALDDRELLATLAAFRSFDKDHKRQVQAYLRRTALPLFRRAYRQRPRGPQQSKAAGIGSITLTQAGVGQLKGYSTGARRLSGGLDPATDWPWIEFGTRTPGYAGTRLPRWQKSGRIFYSAAAATAPVIAQTWMRATFDLMRDELGAED